MEDCSFNYVRTMRRRHGLSEDELAGLIGLCSHSSISAFEAGECVPRLSNALALQVVFGLAPRELFPGLYEVVEERVMLEAHHLYKSLEGSADRRSEAKRRLLEEMAARRHDNDITL